MIITPIIISKLTIPMVMAMFCILTCCRLICGDSRISMKRENFRTTSVPKIIRRIIRSVRRSTNAVPSNFVNGIFSYRFIIPKRAISPPRGITWLVKASTTTDRNRFRVPGLYCIGAKRLRHLSALMYWLIRFKNTDRATHCHRICASVPCKFFKSVFLKTNPKSIIPTIRKSNDLIILFLSIVF